MTCPAGVPEGVEQVAISVRQQYQGHRCRREEAPNNVAEVQDFAVTRGNLNSPQKMHSPRVLFLRFPVQGVERGLCRRLGINCWSGKARSPKQREERPPYRQTPRWCSVGTDRSPSPSCAHESSLLSPSCQSFRDSPVPQRATAPPWAPQCPSCDPCARDGHPPSRIAKTQNNRLCSYQSSRVCLLRFRAILVNPPGPQPGQKLFLPRKEKRHKSLGHWGARVDCGAPGIRL